jgi:ferric-dicitrate binding protein FerR (iron transport regulator)
VTGSFEALGQKLRADLEPHAVADPVSAARVRRQILARHAPGIGRGSRLRYAVPALGVALCVAAALLLWRPAATEPLRFWVEGNPGQIDAWLTARDTEQSLRFSDGSSIVASPSTTTRVMAVLPDGAALTLERGQLDAHVVHRDSSRWRVAAGPFVVHVTGTRFRVVWDPQLETMQVRVSEGRVVVSGGGHPEHTLVAGSQLELRVTERGPLPASSVTGGAPAEPPPPAPESARDEDELIVPRKPSEPAPDWRELSTSGRYREALASVEQRGFAQQCSSLPARDLLTLGSTARLAGNSARATEAYSAARRRFPGSSEAAISAFSLGRLASDAGRAGVAVEWFQRYLREQPNGQLAREAEGRLIEHFRGLGSTGQARAAAERYLKQYPTGPHAALARSVLASP